MTSRYKENRKHIHLRPFSALKESFREGYTLSTLRADVLAGIVVGLVALPLGMALAIASKVPPQYGLYTVIVAGAVVAALGGSRCQVTGPTAAFVVILAPIVQKFGFSGLLIAGLMAGVMLILMGAAGLGRLIQFIPHPVTTGFTAGIAVVIAAIQIKDFFGLSIAHMPDGFFERLLALFDARRTASPPEFLISMTTLLILVVWPKINKKIPGPLVALSAAALLAIFVERMFPGVTIATIGNRFGGIPQAAPSFVLPWNFGGPGGGEPFRLSLEVFESLVPSAFAIAMLAAIESLLSAVVADGMAHTRHDPDSELVALGVGNVICPFFGGIAATGAIARTATNIRFGGKTPIAAITHSVFVLLAIFLFAPAVSNLPMAALAALLVVVAYNMSEHKHFFHVLKVAPRSDVIVLLICFSLTVLFDMVVGVSVGIVLAALLFMRRMASLTSGEAIRVGDAEGAAGEALPAGVLVYRIAGPFFFGAAQTAISAINTAAGNVKVVVFTFKDVPTMDVTGLVALEAALAGLKSANKTAILVEVKGQPLELIQKAAIIDGKHVIQCRTILEGIECARNLVGTSAALLFERAQEQPQ